MHLCLSLYALPRFAEVVNAYEVLSDQKKRQAYDRKRKYTPPFGGVRDAASGATSWGRSAYDGARKEASRRWKEQNPGPQDIGEEDSAPASVVVWVYVSRRL